MMKIRLVAVLLAIALGLTSFALPAQARHCDHRSGHEICLERVRRSAKYHWRYRVEATVDGQRQPLTRYDCRDRTRTPLSGPHQGHAENFTAGGIGDQLCRLLDR